MFQYYGFFVEFLSFFKVLFLGMGLKKKTQKSQKIFISWVSKAKMNVDLLLNHYFNNMSIKTT